MRNRLIILLIVALELALVLSATAAAVRHNGTLPVHARQQITGLVISVDGNHLQIQVKDGRIATVAVNANTSLDCVGTATYAQPAEIGSCSAVNLLSASNRLITATTNKTGRALASITLIVTGSANGEAAVGKSTPWLVNVGSATGTMYPGAGASTLPYTITNTGAGDQALRGTKAVVDDDGNGNIVSGGNQGIPGCRASWFQVTNTPPAPGVIHPSDSVTGSVTVRMTESGTNQDACQKARPDITVTAF